MKIIQTHQTQTPRTTIRQPCRTTLRQTTLEMTSYYSALNRKDLQELAKEGKLSEYNVNGKSSNVRIIEAVRQRDIDNETNTDKETDKETEEASNPTESEEEDKNVLEGIVGRV